MEEKDVVSEVELATSSTLSDNCKTVMRKLIEDMAPIRSIYDVYLGDFEGGI